MRNLLVISLITVLSLGCKLNETKKSNYSDWSVDSVSNYYKSNFAYSARRCNNKDTVNLYCFKNFSKLILKNKNSKTYYNPLIYALNEPYIDTTNFKNYSKWFRVIVFPCFRTPYCLSLLQNDDKTILTLKMTDGVGGYNTGILDFQSTFYCSDSVYNNFSKQLRELDFWDIKNDSTCFIGRDGEMWTFEGIENGKYSFAERWVPLNCGNEQTKRLAKLCLTLRNLAKFDIYMKLNHKAEFKDWYSNGR